jgi:hypothetical protein
VVGEDALCGRRFTHPCLPTQFDALGYLVVEICVCLRLAGHEHGGLCEDNIERLVYRVRTRVLRDSPAWRATMNGSPHDDSAWVKAARAWWAKAKKDGH